MNESKILAKNFIQRIIDEDNESEKTQDRLVEWAKKILEEAE